MNCCRNCWVSVKEEDPPFGMIIDGTIWSKTVLVYTTEGIGVSECCLEDENGESGWCDVRSLDNLRTISADKITHWMPLPELPKES